MKNFIKSKATGFYFLVIAIIVEIISFVRFLLWAGMNRGMDRIIVAGFIVGIVLGVVAAFWEKPFIMPFVTTGFSIAGIRLLTNSIGSFVDAYQGIKMFGDATQVGNIISIASLIMVGILAVVIASFLRREKS